MTSTTLRSSIVTLLVGLACTIGVISQSGRPAWAHNSLVSSDPADGSLLGEAPSQITWTFDKDVPLESMTVTLIDETMTRTALTDSRHGPQGTFQVVTPLPALSDGDVSLRWKLVGADGHAVTGRVDFTLATGAIATTITGASAALATQLPEPSDVLADDASSTSSMFRWLLRAASYLAIMAVVGTLLMGAWVWPDASTHRPLQRVVSRGLLAAVALALVQLLVLASDIGGSSWWGAWRSVDETLAVDAGMALAIRMVLALALWIVLFRQHIPSREVYWTSVGLGLVGLLGTWAFAGHSRSMRWPELGVVADVLHHGAAALWLTGLAILAFIVIPSEPADVVGATVRAFSRLAAWCVGVLVLTGLLQSIRLVGNPGDLLSADHGRYLVLKVGLLAIMLVAARANRRRVQTGAEDGGRPGFEPNLMRRAIVIEFVLGMAIIGITAAMVVSPPSTSIL